MRLAFLSTSMGLGGADKQILNIGNELKKRGHQVLIISVTEPGPMGHEAKNRGLDIRSLKLDKRRPNPFSLFRGISLLKRWKPDVLITFMYHANVIGKLMGKIIGIPVIINSIRNERFGGRIKERLEALTNPLSDLTVTNSAITAESLIKRGIVKRSKIRVIYNGIIIDKYRRNNPDSDYEQWPGISGLDQSSFLWLAVGRLREQKDYSTLLQALTYLKGLDYRLMIAGEGPLKAGLLELTQELDLQDRVVFLGARQDIPGLLQAADGFVLSSAWEGLPNVVMEAAASARPIVATEVGGVPELLSSVQQEFMVPPGDPEALGLKMRELMGRPEKELKNLGRANQEHIKERFILTEIVNQWEEVLLSLFKKKEKG